MNRFDGTSARQLDLLDDMEVPVVRPASVGPLRPADAGAAQGRLR